MNCTETINNLQLINNKYKNKYYTLRLIFGINLLLMQIFVLLFLNMIMWIPVPIVLYFLLYKYSNWKPFVMFIYIVNIMLILGISFAISDLLFPLMI